MIDRINRFRLFNHKSTSGAPSLQRGEVVANTSSALFLYDPEGSVCVNGVTCKALPHAYDIREKDGRIVTYLKSYER